ncbi:MAG: OmpA family protein [Bryobacterales bacterium]|nr:OmpA family protein [Nitrospira sp.]MCW5966814.1 OmpA family protein [Bryobacterales bacterium]
MNFRSLVTKLLGVCLIGMIALAPAAVAQSHSKDVKGSSDHPLFKNRMPGYYISSYQKQGFGSFQFGTQPPSVVEGTYYKINYYLDTGEPHPGALAVRRNYENAIKAVGGELVFAKDPYTVMKVNVEGVETWIQVQAGTNRYLYMNIVERTAMTQVIQANEMAKALETDGFIPLDIHFDTGKADILPDSMPLIEEIVKLLQSQPALMVGVEGHTDNTGTAEGNKTLSEARAKSVVVAIVAKGIAANRLVAAGYGQERPISDNRTASGRAVNRRVELVKR